MDVLQNSPRADEFFMLLFAMIMSNEQRRGQNERVNNFQFSNSTMRVVDDDGGEILLIKSET